MKEVPSNAVTISHILMLRAGMIRKLAAGIYTYLPPGLRAIHKIERITIGKKGLKDGNIEVKLRREKEPVFIPGNSVAMYVKSLIQKEME